MSVFIRERARDISSVRSNLRPQDLLQHYSLVRAAERRYAGCRQRNWIITIALVLGQDEYGPYNANPASAASYACVCLIIKFATPSPLLVSSPGMLSI